MIGSPEIILGAGNSGLHRIFVMTAALVGAWLIQRDSKSWNITPSERLAIILLVTYASLLGAALPARWAGGFIGEIAQPSFYSSMGEQWSLYMESLVGPKTILGGLLCGFFAAALFKKIRGIGQDTSDAFARGTCLMMAIGRLGCIAQHCCYGRVTTGPWGVDLGDHQPRVPVQLMEAIFLFALFCVLNHWHRQRKFENRRLFLLFLIYGIGRFALEGLREPLAQSYLGMGYYQWIALALAATGAFQLYKRGRSPAPSFAMS